ncbi:hypothetical protein V3C99_004801 [Haemonchus contortus]
MIVGGNTTVPFALRATPYGTSLLGLPPQTHCLMPVLRLCSWEILKETKSVQHYWHSVPTQCVFASL